MGTALSCPESVMRTVTRWPALIGESQTQVTTSSELSSLTVTQPSALSAVATP